METQTCSIRKFPQTGGPDGGWMVPSVTGKKKKEQTGKCFVWFKSTKQVFMAGKPAGNNS